MPPKGRAAPELSTTEGDKEVEEAPEGPWVIDLEPPGMAKLRIRMPEIKAEFFERGRIARERYEAENAAGGVLQRYWRGHIVRRNLNKYRAISKLIQRMWRGYMGRVRFKAHLEEHNRKLRVAYFTMMATLIQKCWRGYLSRRHVHSFSARKRYLQMVAAKNAEMRMMLDQEFQRTLAEQQMMEEDKAQQRFGAKISGMHHLVSTASQPGIFNSPYAQVTGGTPVVAGRPVEDHLQGTVQGLWATQRASRKSSGVLPPITDRPPATNYSKTGRMAALQAMATHESPNLSLQAQPPYNMVHDENQMEEYIKRVEILKRHPQEFLTTIMEPVPDRHRHFQLPALKNDTEFLENNEPLKRDAPDSLSQKMMETHPHITKPFATQINPQTYFQETLNLEAQYYQQTQT